ncbi:MAG TPA: imidazoleglycerol-phosphate dehydratase, partial [Phycisphaerae bacterium]|nr:imidazoleglycerol-phosphate dehydratase [Phycisphaerae bacterium]
MNRTAEIKRKTNETEIEISLNLDGKGCTDCKTGVGFLDHMLDHLGKHSLCDMTVRAKGDLQVDAHHTVEDVAICLGEA